MHWLSLLAIGAALTAGCSTPSERSSGSASAAPSATSVPEPVVDRVTWNDAGLLLGDHRLDPPPADVPGRMQGLFRALKQQREQWKQQHPGDRFRGAMVVEVPREAVCNRVASVLQSVADAGYDDVTLRSGESAQRVPGLWAGDFSSLARGASRLFFRRDGQIELFLREGYAPFDVVQPKDLAAAAAEQCGGGECLQQAQVFCEPGVPFSQVMAALGSLAKAQPQMALTFGREPAAQRPWTEAASPPRDVPLPLKRKARRAVRISSLTTSDNLTLNAVKPALERQLNDLVSCYEETAHMPASRLMKTELEIGKKGGVTNVTIRGDDLIDYDLDCLYRALAKTSMPAPAGGKSGLVSCGFAFTRSP